MTDQAITGQAATEPATDGLSVRGSLRRGEFELAVDLHVGGGEIVALLGPNGAGKSTLLNVVCGLLGLDRGTVAIGGLVVDRAAASGFVPPQRRRVGMVFQDHRLFPHLRVVDNVAFGLRAHGTGRAAARAQALVWLDRLGLGELAGRRPGRLSGGQAQRVALARALASEPDVLVLDEPLAALDVQTRAQVQGELRTHLRRFAGPVVIVTHDPIEALLLADRIVVLEHGSIVQQGSAADITSRPLTPYVARLVGVNLYRGTGSNGQIDLDGGGLLATEGRHEGAVLAAVRPSAFSVHTDEVPTADTVWQARIDSLSPLGDRVRLGLIGTQAALADVDAADVALLDLAPGREVWLGLAARDVTVYEPLCAS